MVGCTLCDALEPKRNVLYWIGQQSCQYLESRDLQGGPFIIDPLCDDKVAGFPDAVQRAIQMGKFVELQTSSACTFDHPLVQVVRSVGVVVQDVPVQGLVTFYNTSGKNTST